ncbi:uncharacterized protein LOC123536183 [Mercenaria mercenaria]|uniref:uncharacterized protein LOC123536183 n=1 Tax=Mercenaria mercenaria TaxID=6596 RepID=UPI00234E4DD0|nr:uncharacterized protein LOC123536183 [Mercenaria mercenaria]XP_045175075.2 uncharacterized protein LOC123536183 [Mercenaria mercenaria]XP_045175076.2 uncharacterized protein LOC123536183 [Mercenaria mercenaria]
MVMDLQSVLLILLFGPGNLILCNDVQYCPEGKFQPVEGGPCKECSRCPENQIVRETCWQQRDTVCGTFTDFQLFHRENDLDILHVDSEANNLNKERDAYATSSWQTASIAMIVLLSVTTVICAVLIGTVCYRCRRDSKDGLMIYVDKDSAESPSPGCSDAVSRCSASTDDIIKASPKQEHRLRSNSNVNESRNEKHPRRNHKIQQFEITEKKPNT